MAKQVQFRRGSAADHGSFTGAAGEITVDTTNNRAVVHDGATPGGHPLAKASQIPSLPLSLANGGLAKAFTDPNADRVLFWDDSAGEFAWLQVGTGLSISGTTLEATAAAAPLAAYEATITPTLLTGNISSVDTGTDIITWSTSLSAQGVVTGDSVHTQGGTWPSAIIYAALLYIRIHTATTFSLYLTLADALADTNRINLTNSGSGTRTMRKLVHSNVLQNSGVSSVSPIGGAGENATKFPFLVNFSPALSVAPTDYLLQIGNLFNAPGILYGIHPSIVTTAALGILDFYGDGSAWISQTNAVKVKVEVYA